MWFSGHLQGVVTPISLILTVTITVCDCLNVAGSHDGIQKLLLILLLQRIKIMALRYSVTLRYNPQEKVYLVWLVPCTRLVWNVHAYKFMSLHYCRWYIIFLSNWCCIIVAAISFFWAIDLARKRTDPKKNDTNQNSCSQLYILWQEWSLICGM